MRAACSRLQRSTLEEDGVPAIAVRPVTQLTTIVKFTPLVPGYGALVPCPRRWRI